MGGLEQHGELKGGISKLCYSGSLCLADGLKTPKIEIGFLIVHVILRITIKNE